MDKEKELKLKRLLADERNRCKEWRQNYESLKESHISLQVNYLESKSELKGVLEHAKQIKESKDNELEGMRNQLVEKEKQVEACLSELKDKANVEDYFKEKCRQDVDEFRAKARKECDLLRMEKMRLANENGILKQKNEHLEQEIEIKLRNLVLEHQNELNALSREKDELRTQFKEAKKHPDYDKLMKLTDENKELNDQISNLLALAADADDKYKRIDEDRERLINEQNTKLKRFETKLANSEQDGERQKQEIMRLKNEIKMQVNQVETLKNGLLDEQRSRESVGQQHLNELKRKQKETDDLKQQLNEANANYELLIDQLKQDKKKLKNDYEDARDEIRKLENSIEQKEKDWSKELSKAIQLEKGKFNCLTKEKQTLSKEKEETDDRLRKLKDDLDLKQKQIEQATTSRFELEKEIKQLKAQIVTLKLSESEMHKLRKEFDVLYEDFKKLRNDNSELNALTKQLDRENVSLKDQFTMYRNEIEEEKKQFYDYKQNSERNANRTKNSFDLERSALREEIEELKDAIRVEKHKRKEIKAKCVQYCEVARKLHKHLKQFESESNTKLSFRTPISRAPKGTKQIEPKTTELQSDLRKQYKEMKRMLNEIQNSDYCKVHQPVK